ncbi:MAG: SGNH/GDSL hydrolase family protein [Bacteroidetes bacterium]|nr:SGNH/GDSL hydrolase family protein [Bacteroidota bacterium]
MSSTFKRAPFLTNQWGMRDQEYTQAKPDSTYRVAFLGVSVEMGAGVEGHETFEAVAEVRLNEEFARQAGSFARYEILNFAVGGYSALQHLARIEEVLAFQPNLLIYTGHTVEKGFLLEHLAKLALSDMEIPDHLAAIIQRAGVGPSLLEAEIRQRLEPFVLEALGEQYRRIVTHCREAGTLPIWLFVPRTIENARDGWSISSTEDVMTLAREAGFIVLDIKDAYENVEDIEGELFLATWDDHPSVYGHQLLGTSLYKLLVENGAELGLADQPADTVDAGAETPESLE